MSTTTTNNRLQQLRRQAEDKAWSLVQHDLRSSDPKLARVCQRLARFLPALKQRDVSEFQARSLIKAGLASVKTKVDQLSDEDAVVALLEGLVDKLDVMAVHLGV